MNRALLVYGVSIALWNLQLINGTEWKFSFSNMCRSPFRTVAYCLSLFHSMAMSSQSWRNCNMKSENCSTIWRYPLHQLMLRQRCLPLLQVHCPHARCTITRVLLTCKTNSRIRKEDMFVVEFEVPSEFYAELIRWVLCRNSSKPHTWMRDKKEVRQMKKHITQNGKLGLSKKRRKGENSTINEMKVRGRKQSECLSASQL